MDGIPRGRTSWPHDGTIAQPNKSCFKIKETTDGRWNAEPGTLRDLGNFRPAGSPADRVAEGLSCPHDLYLPQGACTQTRRLFIGVLGDTVHPQRRATPSLGLSSGLVRPPLSAVVPDQQKQNQQDKGPGDEVEESVHSGLQSEWGESSQAGKDQTSADKSSGRDFQTRAEGSLSNSKFSRFHTCQKVRVRGG